ncbi:hypothetical protein ACFP65_08215 [Marinilactibacillus sp. GCM10026970]|uniref:hypothetical protein n=1 Tax=Marinilactibacillus sp. GCM10026970 TaxID=3252642 RepID=UPI00361720FD
MELRELKGDDLFDLLNIVGKLDIKEEFIQMFEKNVESTATIIPMDHKEKEPTKAEKEKAEKRQKQLEKEAEKRGMEAMAGLLQKVLLNSKKLKVDINDLLASLTDTKKSDIEELGLTQYTGLIIQFFKKPELKDFFTSIASLLQ